MKRGEIWWADLGEYYGSEQNGKRPVVIIQNDMGNYYSPTTICVPCTSAQKKYLPTHVQLGAGLCVKPGTVLCEQIKTISKERCIYKIGNLPGEYIAQIETAIKISLDL